MPQVQAGVWEQGGRSGFGSSKAKCFDQEARIRQRTSGDSPRYDSGWSATLLSFSLLCDFFFFFLGLILRKVALQKVQQTSKQSQQDANRWTVRHYIPVIFIHLKDLFLGCNKKPKMCLHWRQEWFHIICDGLQFVIRKSWDTLCVFSFNVRDYAHLWLSYVDSAQSSFSWNKATLGHAVLGRWDTMNIALTFNWYSQCTVNVVRGFAA